MEFKKYTRVIKVNGHDVNAAFTISVQEEDVDSCIETYDTADRESVALRMQRADLFFGYVRVTASALELEGIGDLGACELVPNNMFNSGPFEASVAYYIKEYSLEEEAIAELTKKLETEYERLSTEALIYRRYAKEGSSK